MEQPKKSEDILLEAFKNLEKIENDSHLRAGTGKALVALCMSVNDLRLASININQNLSKLSGEIEKYSATSEKQMKATINLTKALVFFTAIQALSVLLSLFN